MIKGSIWKDTYYTTNALTLVYTIETDGEVIFSGKAYKYPNAEELKVNINKICRNYLSNDIQSLLESNNASEVNVNTCKEFTLKDENGAVLETYTFLCGYDYQFDWNGAASTLSLPINGHYVPGMLTLRTTVSSTGTVTNYKTNSDYTHSVCADYALYYLNTRGGWDSFVIEGNVQKSDKITQYTTDKAFNNNTLDFENNRYVSEVETQYVMNTGLLNDEESQNLAKNLIGSNRVYVHNIKEQRIFPAIITDTNAVYQTYATNGKKMAQYKINIKESQSKIRK